MLALFDTSTLSGNITGDIAKRESIGIKFRITVEKLYIRSAVKKRTNA